MPPFPTLSARVEPTQTSLRLTSTRSRRPARRACACGARIATPFSSPRRRRRSKKRPEAICRLAAAEERACASCAPGTARQEGPSLPLPRLRLRPGGVVVELVGRRRKKEKRDGGERWTTTTTTAEVDFFSFQHCAFRFPPDEALLPLASCSPPRPRERKMSCDAAESGQEQEKLFSSSSSASKKKMAKKSRTTASSSSSSSSVPLLLRRRHSPQTAAAAAAARPRRCYSPRRAPWLV